MGRYARDSVSTSVIIAIGFVLGTLTGMFVYPKLFDKADQGIFRYLNGWGVLFAQFCSFGVGSAAIRIYYRLKDERAFGELSMLLFLVPLLGVLLFSILFIPFYGFFLHKTLNGLPFEGWAVVCSLMMIVIASTYIKTYQSIATVLKKSPALFFVTEILFKIGILVVFMLYYYEVLDRTYFLLALGFVFLIQLFCILYIIRPFFRQYPMVMPTYEKTKPVLSLSLFCLVDNSASMLVAQIDLMMVGILCADSLVRIQEYGIAIQVASVIFLPWRSFSSTSIPFIAEAFSRNDFHAIDSIYRKTSLNLTIFGLTVFILIFGSIDNIIAIIPDNYEIIKYPVLFMGIAKIIDMMFSVNGNIIALSPHYKVNLYLSLCMIVMLFILNWVFIPIIGITGSALATAIAMLVFNVIRGWFLYKKYQIHPFHRKTPEVLLVLGSILLMAMFIPNIHPSVFISLCVRSAIVSGLVYLYLTFQKPSEDIEKIRRNVLRKLRLVK